MRHNSRSGSPKLRMSVNRFRLIKIWLERSSLTAPRNLGTAMLKSPASNEQRSRIQRSNMLRQTTHATSAHLRVVGPEMENATPDV
eukprot:11081363-Lingulodinium_polyedra.AAC.1